MNLEAAKEELKRRIDGLQDEQAVQDLLLQVEFLLDPLPPDVVARQREAMIMGAEASQADIEAGRVMTLEEFKAKTSKWLLS